MKTIIRNDDHLFLEKKLVRLRVKIFKTNLNLMALSFCSFIFMPVIMVMISLNPDIAIQFSNAMEEKSESVKGLVEEYNDTIRRYNAL